MNRNKEYIEIASQELLSPTFDVTKQYLEVLEVENTGGKPVVSRVSAKNSNDIVSVYFSVKNERFYIVVSLSIKQEIEINWVWVESGHRVYLTVTSDKYTYNELTDSIKLKPLTGWSKNDLRRGVSQEYGFTRVSFEPNTNEAFGLEEKLLELLEELEKNKKEVLELCSKTIAVIAVCRNQYISANAGIHLDLKTINKLHDFELELDIDQYIFGKEINDPDF